MAGNVSVEEIKDKSRALRGTIAETLAGPADHFNDEEYQLLKFHGTYQQDNRDERSERRKQNLDKAYSFMVRAKMPGGKITGRQYLDLDLLADSIANGTMRITTRQGIQYHGVLKVGLKECISKIKQSGLTTWGACGDVVRNTMGPSSPIRDAAHADTQALAKEISDTFLARSNAYAEIWLDGEKLNTDASTEEDPIYLKHYLPRKFKIGIVIPPRNDVDVYSQDLGFVAHLVNGKVEGYTVLAGGGFGMTHGMAKTYPVLAKPLFYVKREHAVAAAVAVVTTQRDHGNRSDRKLSRLKYLIEGRGLDWFRDEVKARLNVPTEPAKDFQFSTVGDQLGWHEQGDGKLFCGIYVSMGRIQDKDGVRYRSGLRALAGQFKENAVYLTPNCNFILSDITPDQKPQVDALLAEYGIQLPAGITEARRIAHACVALPTCGLSLAESERVFPSVLDSIDGVLRELKLEQEPILFRMSGCPNGCSRPYNSDFAFVGRAPGKYAFYVGGAVTGDRLAGLEKKAVEEKDIASAVRPYLVEFAAKRNKGETFSQYWGRTHSNGPAPMPEQFHVELTERAAKLAGTKAEPVGAE